MNNQLLRLWLRGKTKEELIQLILDDTMRQYLEEDE